RRGRAPGAHPGRPQYRGAGAHTRAFRMRDRRRAGQPPLRLGPQLQEALARIEQEGRGVLILLRGHEGRGIGLVEKLRAYALQESGRDTVDANVELGLPVDARSFLVAAQILEALGVQSVRLLSHNPVKTEALQLGGIEVTETIDLATHPTPENLRYLTTKRDRLGHHLLGLPGQ